ncbi:MAG: LytTR family DNA-binding domain-containing protein [Eubacteriales bacterium]|nr:LytTR family DNA-binding domain-containing protein [Eubacteriales bacterium]
MRLAIVEDDKEDREKFITMAEKWAYGENISVETQEFSSGEAFTKDYQPGQFDLIFMDVFMRGMDGIETVKQIRQGDRHVLVVFVTNSREYIFKAAPLHIFDYINKPCSYERMAYVLSEAQRTLPEQDKTLDFVCGRQEVSLKMKEIMYIEADNNYTVFTVNGETYRYRISFSGIAALLPELQFLNCTRGIMLNMEYIQDQDNDTFEMTDGKKFPIRRNGRKQIIGQYEQYQFSKLENI